MSRFQPTTTRRAFLQTVACQAGAGIASVAAEDQIGAGNTQPGRHTAVVELFTSQGCSSCPPADSLLRELVRQHTEDALPVLCLSFHVDYWNYLGWSDPFSSARWSRRQRSYSKLLEDRVYTPQMIINGRKGFVGSRRKQLDALLPDQMSVTPEHVIALKTTLRADQKVEIDFDVQGESEGWIVNLALIAHSLTAKATRGENAGRTLTHANVVRGFVVRRLSDGTAGQVLMDRPQADQSEHAVIAYVQNNKRAMITGAAESVIG